MNESSGNNGGRWLIARVWLDLCLSQLFPCTFLPPFLTPASPDFLSCDLLSSLNNKYPAVDTWKNQKHCDSAESGITLMWAGTLIFLRGDAWTSIPLVLGGRVQRGGFPRVSGQAIAKWRPWELGGFFLFPQVKRPHSALLRLRSKGPSGALGWQP